MSDHICIPRYHNGTQCWCLRPIAGACLALLLAVDPAQACTPTRDTPPQPPKVEKPERDTGGDHNWWEEPRRSQQIRGGSDGC